MHFLDRRENVNDKKLDNCNYIKAILMICVVLYHSMAVYLRGGWGPIMPSTKAPIIGVIAEWLNSFHIYTFVLVSGYIFYALKVEQNKYKKYISFIKKKTMRLIVPYIFVTLVWAVPVYIIFWGYDIKRIINNFFLGVSPNQLWFLLMLFWVFVIFWGISNVTDRHPIIGIGLALTLYFVGIITTNIPNYYNIRTGLQYVIFFCTGFLLRKYDFERLKRFPSVLYIAVDIFLFAINLKIGTVSGLIWKMGYVGTGFLLHQWGSIAAFIILQKVMDRSKHLNNRILYLLSVHSMTIFLFHQQIIYFSISLFNGKLNSLFLVVVNFLISIFVSMLLSMLLRKWNITRFLLGNAK